MVWLEINKVNLWHNIKQFQKLIGKKKLCLVVKANAYGHGLIGISKIISKKSQNIWLGVNSVDEAIILRKNGIKNPILILGYVELGRLKKAVDIGARLTVYNLETIKKLGQLKEKAFVHLKVETGTGRQGILLEDIVNFAKEIKKYPNIRLEGLSTHFANIEDTTNHKYAQKQLDIFKEVVSLLEKNKIRIPIKHIACTAAAILFPETHFDMARVGIGLYGLWSSKETFISALQKKKKIILKPVLTWKTKVIQIKKMKAGSFIGYGCTKRLNKDSVIVVLPVGYSDGYDRKLSSVGNVLIHGQRARIVGRVCMNMIMADVSDIENVKLEDEVVLLGKQNNEEITAEEIADKVGTINYEIVSRINPLLPRKYV